MNIFLTPKAESDFHNIIHYLEEKWGRKSVKAFIQKTDDLLNLLKQYPLMGQKEIKEIRGFQLSPQIRILYRIDNENLIILAFFVVRQNPNKKLS
jgi:plasmid stabilization system protein ParE